jgi:hypothetical protein
MDVLFWVLIGIGFVLWLFWYWGRNSGLQEGLRERSQLKSSMGREIDKLQEQLAKTTKEHAIEKAALETALTQAKKYRDAFRPAASVLGDIRAKSPAWINADPFLLLAPGQLNQYTKWAQRAAEVWSKVDALSGAARLTLEQTISEGVREPNPIQLVSDVIEVFEDRPSQLEELNLFDLRTAHFEQLHSWFADLTVAAMRYMASVYQIEVNERDLQRALETAAASSEKK